MAKLTGIGSRRVVGFVADVPGESSMRIASTPRLPVKALKLFVTDGLCFDILDVLVADVSLMTAPGAVPAFAFSSSLADSPAQAPGLYLERETSVGDEIVVWVRNNYKHAQRFRGWMLVLVPVKLPATDSATPGV